MQFRIAQGAMKVGFTLTPTLSLRELTGVGISQIVIPA